MKALDNTKDYILYQAKLIKIKNKNYYMNKMSYINNTTKVK